MSSITYLEAIRLAQEKALADDPRVFLYGQDVGNFGGAFKATKNLAKEFPGRVFDAPLSEDAIIGMAVGAAIEGMRPIVEMQFADFSTCGFNQIVNHAATLYYRTGVPCPIVVRLPSGGTSGGGPFHSQSMEALYAHYPGLVVMTPATVEDAYSMLLEAVALWEGLPVRAALVVDDGSTSSSTTLYRDTFSMFGDQTPLYSLEWVPRRAARRRRDELSGMGDFGDLERLLTRTVAR